MKYGLGEGVVLIQPGARRLAIYGEIDILCACQTLSIFTKPMVLGEGESYPCRGCGRPLIGGTEGKTMVTPGSSFSDSDGVIAISRFFGAMVEAHAPA